MPSFSRRLETGAALGLIAALGALVATPARAVGRPMDLATMTERAGTIVVGRIVELRPGSHPKYPNVGALYVTLKVNEMIKGAPAETFTFMQFSGRAATEGSRKGLSSARPLPDMPAYRVGEEVVLFLYPTSSAGYTSPVGGEQGKFLVQRVPGQPAKVVSEAGSRFLAVDGSLPRGLTPSQQNLLRQPGDALDFGAFRGAVKALTNKPR